MMVMSVLILNYLGTESEDVKLVVRVMKKMTTKPDLQLHKIGIFKIKINDQLILIEKWIFIVMGVFSLCLYSVL